MFQLARPLFLTCETPLHAGSGDSLGIVDLPIQRERHTSFPKIEASSLKGALREAFEEKVGKTQKNDIIKAFGPEENGDEHAGALGFTDARLLLFPVKSMKGVFAWIICPKVLRQFSEALKLSVEIEINGIISASDNQAVPLSDETNLAFGKHIVLEEYTFNKAIKVDLKIGSKSLADWLADNLFVSGSFWHEKAKKDILLLSDNDFKDFVNLSTEVITRIKIDNETGTVQSGALFTEEYLPAECVLYSLVLASPEFLNSADIKVKIENSDKTKRHEKADPIMKFFIDGLPPVVQLGGNATLGKGLLRTKIVLPYKNPENNG
ncbi:MAG: type III-B CRISPR module RAMP protein Cmr4 [Saprospiraceae bacterium]|nr:type III-B CRISPR module RAMP protein Cmr4 [Saprospiraceae bacterium]